MRNGIGKATIFLILAVSVPLQADLITFDTSTDLGGFALGGYMRWHSGPGHVFMNNWTEDDWMNYNQGSGIFTLNSYMLQAEPYDGYGLDNAIVI